MTQFTIYHNPRCSKSRQTLALLQDNGVEPTVIEYLANPPDAQTVEQILAALNLSPRQLMRSKETAYAQEDLGNPSLTDAQLINAMINNPILIERPIVVSGERVIIGRPPENVLELL